MNRYRIVTAESDRARFESGVASAHVDECWLWTRASDDSGYGVIKIRHRLVRAAHLALIYSGRPRPAGLSALHSCDNPPCCNPRHLSWGTQRKNNEERDERDRVRHGSTHRSAKLTESIAIDIRREVANGARQVDLARRYGVSKSTINQVIIGRTWVRAHL